MKELTWDEKINLLQLICGVFVIIGVFLFCLSYFYLLDFNQHYSLWRLTQSVAEHDLALHAIACLERAMNIIWLMYGFPVGVVGAGLLEMCRKA